MEYAALFFILILLLFLLSRVLTSEIYSFSYKITRSENFSISILAFVLFLGVFIHEMAHFLAAKFLLVPTGKVSLFPKKEGDYLKLGSVSVAQSNILKEFIIGAAPLVVGIISILLLVYFILQDLGGVNFLKIILSFMGIFVISNTMYVSRKDFQAALPFLVSVITLGIILIILNVRFPMVTLSFLPTIDFSRIFYMGSIYLGIPIIIDLSIIIIFRIFNRMW